MSRTSAQAGAGVEPAVGAPVEEPVDASAWWLLAFLTSLNVLNFVDRQLIASLAPLLIDDLHVSRAQIGLLIGFTFLVFYTTVGLALGVLADRWRRLPLVAIGLAVWSGMTALSGLAQNFSQLALPRIFVGVGEATLSPAALAMLGDAFPRRRLGLASGVYYAGIPIGTGLSLMLASVMAPRYGWRACFYVLGLVGLVGVAAVRLFTEPPRVVAGARSGSPPRLGTIVGQFARALIERPELALVILGGSLITYTAAAAQLSVTWLVQERAFPFASAALIAGVIGVVAGLLGNVGAGWFADWCDRRWPGGRVWSLVLMALAFAPIGVAFYTAPPSSPAFYVCWFAANAVTMSWFGPLFAAIQHLSPAETRATTVAFALLVLSVLGIGPGPWLTGVIGDYHSLTAGLVVSVGVGVIGVVPLALAARRVGRGPGHLAPAESHKGV